MPQPGTEITAATLYFSPACPWTWRTSRWLVDAAQRRGVDVSYRPFDLAGSKPLEEMPEQYRTALASARCFMRAVQAAGTDRRDDLIAAAYTLYGTQVYYEGVEATPELVEKAWREVGGEVYVEAFDDAALDQALLDSTAEARENAGDDVGSPVIVYSTASGQRGFFGPVVTPSPSGEAADRLWELVTAAVNSPDFFELKTRRTRSPGD